MRKKLYRLTLSVGNGDLLGVIVNGKSAISCVWVVSAILETIPGVVILHRGLDGFMYTVPNGEKGPLVYEMKFVPI